jgi:hypothetical protein
MIGTIQLPKPPIAVGMTKKKSSKMREMLLKRYTIDSFLIETHHPLAIVLNALQLKQ